MSEFTTNWFQPFREEIFKSYLGHLKGKLRFLEIGCWEGKATVWMLENFPQAQVTVIDIFDDWEQFKANGVKERFMDNIAPFRERVTVLEGRSQDKLKELNEEYDFIYVDGSHEEEDVVVDTKQAFRLIKSDGIIIFDDYGNSWDGVKCGIDRVFQWRSDYKVLSEKNCVLVVQKI